MSKLDCLEFSPIAELAIKVGLCKRGQRTGQVVQQDPGRPAVGPPTIEHCGALTKYVGTWVLASHLILDNRNPEIKLSSTISYALRRLCLVALSLLKMLVKLRFPRSSSSSLVSGGEDVS